MFAIGEHVAIRSDYDNRLYAGRRGTVVEHHGHLHELRGEDGERLGEWAAQLLQPIGVVDRLAELGWVT